jgi:hypothetical protein
MIDGFNIDRFIAINGSSDHYRFIEPSIESFDPIDVKSVTHSMIQ